jgi:prefoldin subunit 5
MAERKNPRERVKDLLSKGYTKIQAIRALRNEGYNPKDVDRAMADFVVETRQIAKPPKPPELKKSQEPAHASPDNHTVSMLSREIDSLKKELEQARKKAQQDSAKDEKFFSRLKEREVGDIVTFQARLEKIHEEVKVEFKEVTDQMNDFRAQMTQFGKSMEDLRKVDDDIKKLDIKEIRRELEILKTKGHWIEDNLEKLDVKPFMDKMQEVEHKIDRLRATSPFVIE